MTGMIHSYESFGTVDGPGIRFVVFMQGCPMRCLYCHNPDTWDLQNGKAVEVSDVVREALKYTNYFGKTGGVTVSGGEPLLQIEFLIELFTQLKKNGIHTCIDTSGICFPLHGSLALYDRLISVTDLFLLDIKHADEDAHIALTGRSGAHAKAFAQYLSERGKPMWIRHVLVPDLTDEDDALIRLREFIDTLATVEKIEVLPYHSMGKVKYDNMGIVYPLNDTKAPEIGRIENAKKILKA